MPSVKQFSVEQYVTSKHTINRQTSKLCLTFECCNNRKSLDNDQEDVTAHDALTARLLGLALANTPTSMLDPPLNKRNRQLDKPIKTLHYISIHEMALQAKELK